MPERAGFQTIADAMKDLRLRVEASDALADEAGVSVPRVIGFLSGEGIPVAPDTLRAFFAGVCAGMNEDLHPSVLAAVALVHWSMGGEDA